MNNTEVNKVADKAVSDLDNIAQFLKSARTMFVDTHNDYTGGVLSEMALILVGFIQRDIRKLQEAAQNNIHNISNN
jgi:hypothetical protein